MFSYCLRKKSFFVFILHVKYILKYIWILYFCKFFFYCYYLFSYENLMKRFTAKYLRDSFH